MERSHKAWFRKELCVAAQHRPLDHELSYPKKMRGVALVTQDKV
jgi:hypothetical protein